MPIHPTAHIDASAEIDPSASIGPNVVIGKHVIIGPDCEIMSGACIGPFVKMGRGNRVHFHSVIGHEPQYIGFDRKVESWVEIGDNNEFREFTSIHRPFKPGTKTTVGNNCFMMATSHIGHDCTVGNNLTMANYSGIAGHCVIEDRVTISASVGVHQWSRIGRLSMIGGLTGISKDVPPFTMMMGVRGRMVGLNHVGIKRSGISDENRRAISRAFTMIFCQGLTVKHGCEAVRASYAGGTICPEVEHLLAFCEAKSHRGIHHAARVRGKGAVGMDEE